MGRGVSVVFDSSALLAITYGEDGAAVALRAAGDAIMSAVNATEVITRLIDRGASEEEAREILHSYGLAIRPFDEPLAVAAGFLRTATRQYGLSLGDRACLALAMRERAPVVTADRAWARLDLGIDVQVIR